MERRFDMSEGGAANSIFNPNLLPSFHHNRFGGVRHGFTRSDPDRAYQQRLFNCPMELPITLPPLQNVDGFPQWANMRLILENPQNPVSRGRIERENRPSLGEDIRMTTPIPSRRASQIIGNRPSLIGPPSMETRVCVCSQGEPMIVSPSTVTLAQDAFNALASYTRIPVQELLNSSASSMTFSSANSNQATNGIHTANTSNVHTNSTPRVQVVERSQTPSTSTNSNSSTSTIRTPSRLTIEEKRYYLLNTLYNTCVDASITFIQSLRPVLSRRSDHHNHRLHRRYRPYPPPPSRAGRFGLSSSSATASRRAERGGSIDSNSDWRGTRPVPSLMDNISTIATHLWRTARRDALAPRQAEADAVREMRDLYRWGEVVARGFQNAGAQGYDEDMEQSVSSFASGRESGLDLDAEAWTSRRLARAAKRLCEWLGDGEAWDTCQGIMVDLRDLEERGARESVVADGGDGDDEMGSIR